MAASWGVIEALPGACLVMDGEGTILVANTAWREMAPDCQEGNNYLALLRTLAAQATDLQANSLTDDDRLHLAACLGSVGDLLEGRVDQAKGQIRLPDCRGDGQRPLVSMLVHGAVHDGLALMTHQDVSALQKRAESAEATAQRYDLILSHLPFGLYLKDTKLRYVAVNEAFTDVIGWESQDVIGQTDRALYDPGTAQKVSTQEQEIMRKGQRHSEELTVDSHGRTRILSEDKRPVYDHDGQAIGLLGVLTDISDKKRLEQSLKAAQDQVSKANQTQDHFLANISHEIRTPMNALAGLAHLLEQTRLSARQREVVERLRSSTHSLLSILNDVLDVAALETGRLALALAPVHLGELFLSLETALRPLVHEQGLDLIAEIDPLIPAVVQADGLRMQQILIHLLGNAIKFTPQGTVKLLASCHEVQGEQVFVCFKVSDTGIGIAAEQKNALFQLFHQVDTSLTRRYGGVGLGLALASRLVAMMGGEIDVESQEQVGTTFSFVLPFRVADEDELPNIPTDHRLMPLAVADGRTLPAHPAKGDADVKSRVLPTAIDLDDALERLDDDKGLLCELLGQFAESHATSAQQLLAFLDQGELEDAARLAHTLKGSAANLGAKALAVASENLVRTARAQDSEGSLALLVGVRRQLNAVLRDIDELRPRLALQASAPLATRDVNIDRASLSGHLEILEGLLNSNNMAAADVFKDLQSALESVCSHGLVAELGKRIQRLDFSGALGALKQIVNGEEMDQGRASSV
jgi:PAS domain S-box-containing protein